MLWWLLVLQHAEFGIVNALILFRGTQVMLVSQSWVQLAEAAHTTNTC